MAAVALHRGEPINAMWLVVAAIAPTRSDIGSTASLLRPKFLRWTRNGPLLPSDWRMAAILCRRISGWSLAIISPRSPGRARWLARCWPRNLGIFQELCGFSRARSSADVCRIS